MEWYEIGDENNKWDAIFERIVHEIKTSMDSATEMRGVHFK